MNHKFNIATKVYDEPKKVIVEPDYDLCSKALNETQPRNLFSDYNLAVAYDELPETTATALCSYLSIMYSADYGLRVCRGLNMTSAYSVVLDSIVARDILGTDYYQWVETMRMISKAFVAGWSAYDEY